MAGRVVIVTGAGSGLGFHVAKTLCDDGSDVVLAGSDEEQIKAAVEKIKQLKPEAAASSLKLDLSSLESINKFVEEFHATGKKLNALVTCDGVKLSNTTRSRRYTSDNFELTMGTNHLGHFLLTNLLIPDLKSSAADGTDARVVVVASSMHDIKASKQCKNLQPLDLENLFLFNEKTYSSLQAYKNSRAANLLFAYELARRVQDSGIKVNAICPGVEPAEETTPNGNGVHKVFAQVFMQCITAPAPSYDRCAVDVCSLITEEKYKDTTGKYIKEGAEVQSSEETLSEELQSKLWELSARYVKLDGYEPLEVTPPPPEEESSKKKEEKKKKVKKEEKADDENADEKPVTNGTNGHHVDGEQANDEEVNGKGELHENGVEEPKAEEQQQQQQQTTEAPAANGKEEVETEKPAEAPAPAPAPAEDSKVTEESNGVEPQSETAGDSQVENQELPEQNGETVDH